MIAVKLWGGLGNQLFQYAFGLYMTLKRNEPASFYLPDSETKGQPLDLQGLVDINIKSFNDIKKYFMLTGRGQLYRVERKALSLFPVLNSEMFVEPSLFFNHRINEKAKLFDGYWQSYKYVEPVSETLLSELHFERAIVNIPDIISDIERSNSVSIHIRRGDYLLKNNTGIYAGINAKYYLSAIDYIVKTHKNIKIFIFSDDINWVSGNFKLPETIPYTIVDSRKFERNIYLDMFLMSMCKHNIIANSSFSWWGAWLNQNSSKIVIAPSEWYIGKLNNTTSDLIPPNWIRI